MSGSFIVNIFLKAYYTLEIYYKNSFFHKIFCKIALLSKNSFIVNFFVKLIFKEGKNKEMKENSFFINIIDKIFHNIYKIKENIFNYFVGINEQSFLCRNFKNIILPLKNLVKLMLFFAHIGIGFLSTTIILSFFNNGFYFRSFVIKIILLIICVSITFINYEKLEKALQNNVVTKLILWFFND